MEPSSRNPASVAAACLIACRLESRPLIFSFLGFVPSGLGFRSNGTLIISMRWIIVKSLGSSFNDLLKTCLPLKLFLTTSPCLLSDSRITPAAPVGLVPYPNHIKPIYGPYMGHPPFQKLDFGLLRFLRGFT